MDLEVIECTTKNNIFKPYSHPIARWFTSVIIDKPYVSVERVIKPVEIQNRAILFFLHLLAVL